MLCTTPKGLCFWYTAVSVLGLILAVHVGSTRSAVVLVVLVFQGPHIAELVEEVGWYRFLPLNWLLAIALIYLATIFLSLQVFLGLDTVLLSRSSVPYYIPLFVVLCREWL